MSWGGHHKGRGYDYSPNRRGNCNRSGGAYNNYNRDQNRNNDSRNTQYSSNNVGGYSRDYTRGSEIRSGGRSRDYASGSARRKERSRSGSSDRGRREESRSSERSPADDHRPATIDSPSNLWDEYLREKEKRIEEDKRRNRESRQSRSSERSPASNSHRSSSAESSSSNRSRNDTAKSPVRKPTLNAQGTFMGFVQSRAPETSSEVSPVENRNESYLESSTSGSSGKTMTAWNKFLQKETEKVDRRRQDSRNKTTSKPASPSVIPPSQTKANTVVDDDFSLDFMAEAPTYGDDDMSDTMSQMSTISGIHNPRGVMFDVTITYSSDLFYCGECSYKNKILDEAEKHVKSTHTRKAQVIRFKCESCRFATDAMETWKQHVSMSSHLAQCAIAKQKTAPKKPVQEKRNDVDGFAVPRPMTVKSATEATPTNNSKQLTEKSAVQFIDRKRTFWDQQDKHKPWNISEELAKGHRESAKSKGNIVPSKIMEPMKSPPWSKRSHPDSGSQRLGISLKEPNVTNLQSQSAMDKENKSAEYRLDAQKLCSVGGLKTKSSSVDKHLVQQKRTLTSRDERRKEENKVPSSVNQDGNKNPTLTSLAANSRTAVANKKTESDPVAQRHHTSTSGNTAQPPISSEKSATALWSKTSGSANHSVHNEVIPSRSAVTSSATKPIPSNAKSPQKRDSVSREWRMENGKWKSSSPNGKTSSVQSPSFSQSPPNKHVQKPSLYQYNEMSSSGHKHSETPTTHASFPAPYKSASSAMKKYSIPKINKVCHQTSSIQSSTTSSSSGSTTKSTSNSTSSAPAKQKQTVATVDVVGSILALASPLSAEVTKSHNEVLKDKVSPGKSHTKDEMIIKGTSLTSHSGNIHKTQNQGVHLGSSTKAPNTTVPTSQSKTSKVSSAPEKSSGAALVQAKTSATHRTQHNSGHRSRHSSGSTGSTSPLDVQKSPPRTDVQKTKTSLGVKPKNASFDPRDNCVPITATSKTLKPKSSASAPSIAGSLFSNRDSMRKSASSGIKLYQPGIQDPRKITHSSKLSEGAVIAKPMLNFKIPKAKSDDVGTESDLLTFTSSGAKSPKQQMSPEKHKSSERIKSPEKHRSRERRKSHEEHKSQKGQKSPEKQKHGHVQGDGKRRRESTDDSSRREKTKSRKIESRKGADASSCEPPALPLKETSLGQATNQQVEKAQAISDRKANSNNSRKQKQPEKQSAKSNPGPVEPDKTQSLVIDELDAADLSSESFEHVSSDSDTSSSDEETDEATNDVKKSVTSENTDQGSTGSNQNTTPVSTVSTSNETNEPIGADVQVAGSRDVNCFIEIDDCGRMFCWKCDGKMFSRPASALISKHIRTTHMNMNSAIYNCVPCDFACSKSRNFTAHMISQEHNKQLKLVLAKPRPSDDPEVIKDDPPPSVDITTVKVKKEEEMDGYGEGKMSTCIPQSGTNSNFIKEEAGVSGAMVEKSEAMKVDVKVEGEADENVVQTTETGKENVSPSKSSARRKSSDKCTCPADGCEESFFYQSRLKAHLQQHVKKEKNDQKRFLLEARLQEVTALCALKRAANRDKVKQVDEPDQNKNTPARSGQAKLLVSWYKRRKRKLLQHFKYVRYFERDASEKLVKVEMLLQEFRLNRCVFRCHLCGKHRQTAASLWWHFSGVHNIKVRPGQPVGTPSHAMPIEKLETKQDNVSPAEEKQIVRSFLEKYKNDDRYQCDRCIYNVGVRKHSDFREHLYTKHDVYHPNLKHFSCEDCKPVFKTVKQNKIEAHLMSPKHGASETSDTASTSTGSGIVDAVSPEYRKTRMNLLKVSSQYKVESSFVCPQCAKRIAHLDHFNNHMFCNHKVKLSEEDCIYYECAICQPAYRTSFKQKFEKHEQCSRHLRSLEGNEGNKGTKRRSTHDADEEPVSKKFRVSQDEQRENVAVKSKDAETSKSKKSKNGAENTGKPQTCQIIRLLKREEFWCESCEYKFMFVNEIGDHVDNQHPNQNFAYRCDFCDHISMQTLAEFSEHFESEDHCVQLALERSAMDHKLYVIAHGNSDSREFEVTKEGLVCGICPSFTTADFDEMMGHLEEKHSNRKTISFCCDTCYFRSSVEKEIVVHISSASHQRKMATADPQHKVISTNLLYKITKKKKIMCFKCTKSFTVDRLSSHAEGKHQISTEKLLVFCRPCDEIKPVANVSSHIQTVKHQQNVNDDTASIDSESSAMDNRERQVPVKLSTMDNINLEQCKGGEQLPEKPATNTNGDKRVPMETEPAPQTSLSEHSGPDDELVNPEDNVGEDEMSTILGHDLQDENELPTVEHSPTQLHQLQQEPASGNIGSGKAGENSEVIIASGSEARDEGVKDLNHQSRREKILDECTIDELYEELCRRKEFTKCPCGFAFCSDKVAYHLHKGCHCADDWLKCRHCLETFPDNLQFTSHFLDNH